MHQAKEDAIRRRHKIVARQGELLEKEHLYDCQLASKIQTNQAMDENRKLKSQLNMAHHKLHVKDNLLQDSLNCTFVACPCSSNSKAPNMSLIFKLRKKIMELRDLVALQEVELVNMQSSVKYCKIRDLMVEIEALRALVEEGGQGNQEEIEQLRMQLTEANAKLKGKHESAYSDMQSEIQRLRGQSGDANSQVSSYKQQIAELTMQLEGKMKDHESSQSEVSRLKQ